MPKPSLIHGGSFRSKKQQAAANHQEKSPSINPPHPNPTSSSSSNPSSSNSNSSSSSTPSSTNPSSSSPSIPSPTSPNSSSSSSSSNPASPSNPSSSSSSSAATASALPSSSSASPPSSPSSDGRKKTIAGPLAKAAAEQDEDENQTFEQRVIWLVIAVISLLALVILVAPLVLQQIRSQKYQPPQPLSSKLNPGPNHPGPSSHRQQKAGARGPGSQEREKRAREIAEGEFFPSYSLENTVVEDHDAPKFARLATWVTENGGRIGGTEIRSWPGTYERGVYALRDFQRGEMITIPKTICLSTMHGMEQPVIGEYVRMMKDSLPFDENTNDKVALALFITYEKLIRGEQSFWFPYIDTLAPSTTNFTHLFWATDEQLDKHQMHDFLGPYVTGHRQVVQMMHRTARLIPAFDEIDTETLEREALWSYYMVQSRAWGRGDYMELTPYGDIINHRLDGELSTASSESDNSFVVLPHRENQALRKGMELFDSYHHSPTVLTYAQTWGFVPGPSQIYVLYDRSLAGETTSRDRLRLLSTLSCLKGPSHFSSKFRCGHEDFFEDPSPLNCLWALLLPNDVARASLDRIHENRLLHRGNSSSLLDPADAMTALSSLVLLFRSALDKAPDFPSDEILQNDPTLDPIERLMLRTRYMHRRCFLNVIENAEASAMRFLKVHPELVKIAEDMAKAF